MDIMLDLETLGDGPGCVVLSIGAKTFNPGGDGPDHGCDHPSRFYRNIDIFGQLMLGLRIDTGTVDWWRDKSAEARAAFRSPAPIPLEEAVTVFHDWLATVRYGDKPTIWARSPSFDCRIWQFCCELVGEELPWTFRDEMDCRAIERIPHFFPAFPVEKPARVGVHHNALDDCESQIFDVQRVIKRLRYG